MQDRQLPVRLSWHLVRRNSFRLDSSPIFRRFDERTQVFRSIPHNPINTYATNRTTVRQRPELARRDCQHLGGFVYCKQKRLDGIACVHFLAPICWLSHRSRVDLRHLSPRPMRRSGFGNLPAAMSRRSARSEMSAHFVTRRVPMSESNSRFAVSGGLHAIIALSRWSCIISISE